MRSLLRLTIALIASTQLVACVAGDNDSPNTDPFSDDSNIDLEQGGMMGQQLSRETDIQMQTSAATAEALANDDGQIGMEAGAALANVLAGANGATLVDGSSATAQHDSRVGTNGVVDATRTVPQTRIGGEAIPPTTIDPNGSHLPGRRDDAHLGR